MGRGHASPSDMIDAHKLHQFFDDKVTGVRASSADAPPPTYTAAPPGCSLSTFRTFTTDDVIAAVRRLPDSVPLERLVARQLTDFLSQWKLLPDRQSACRANHSTETAVLRFQRTFSKTTLTCCHRSSPSCSIGLCHVAYFQRRPSQLT